MTNPCLIIGPLPPAIGGIATIVGSLKNALHGDESVVFLNTSPAAKPGYRILRPFRSFLNVALAAARSPRGTVLMFSSAHASFWEKCLWCLVFKLFGWSTVVQMVDGNFPRFHRAMSRPAKWLASRLIGNVDIIAAQSPRWKAFYEGIFPRTAIRIVSPGVDTQFFRPPVEREIREGVEICYIGWLIEAKGIYDLLDAARLLKSGGAKFRLKLIGPAFGAEERIADYVEARGLTAQVHMPGPITSRDEIRAAYHSADIFVLPSHFEGFPYALMEASASGLACVGTRVGGIPDILENGQCGILVDSAAPVALAEALSKLIGDADARAHYGSRARARATAQYSLPKSVNDFVSVLAAVKER